MKSQYYGRAAVAGLVGGAIFFLLRSAVQVELGHPFTDLQELSVVAIAGALVACGVAFLRTQSLQFLSDRHDRKRQFEITSDEQLHGD